MKAVQLFLILLMIILAITWVRTGDRFDVRHTLPLLNNKPALYQWGGVALLVLVIWGLSRLKQRNIDDVETPPSARTNGSYALDEDDD